MHRLLLTAAAAVLGAALAAAPAAAQTLEKIKQRGVIVVGSKADYKPFGFRDPSGAIVGFEPDIARLVAERLGVKLELEPVVSSNRMSYSSTIAFANVLYAIKVPMREGRPLGDTQFRNMHGDRRRASRRIRSSRAPCRSAAAP